VIKKLTLLAAGAAVLTACSQGAETTATGQLDEGVEFNVSMPLQEVMAHVIDAGAWGAWNRSGTYYDIDGEHSLAPALPDSATTEDERVALEAEWKAAIDGAAIVAEGGNLLQLPGRVRRVENDDEGENWIQLSQRLTETATRLMEATEAYDDEAMFNIGGELYEVCVACHEKYLVPFLDPETGELPVAPGVPEAE
jgi:hypothetical protein